jgi:hypothetical protein
MRKDGSCDAALAVRRAWKAPVFTAVSIRAETKSGAENAAAQLPEPQPPAAPATKLGFSFEMAFPLSARFE